MSTSSSVNPAVADTINAAAGPEVTAELVRELSVAFQAAHDALKHFVGTVRRFENHVRTLRTEATTLSSVQIHTLPPPGVRRGRGRPRGSRNRTKHIWISRPAAPEPQNAQKAGRVQNPIETCSPHPAPSSAG